VQPGSRLRFLRARLRRFPAQHLGAPCVSSDVASLSIPDCDDEIRQVAVEDARSVADYQIVECIWVGGSKQRSVVRELRVSHRGFRLVGCHVAGSRDVNGVERRLPEEP
jgi:hypothetical protein